MLDELHFPSIRKMFVPDPGYTFFGSDFAQADARVVAWDADCPRLKKIFLDPDRDLHDENAIDLFGKLTKHSRQLAKGGVHAVNYYCKAPTLAKTLGISTDAAQRFIDKWFTLNPEVYDWQQRIENDIHTTGKVSNIWGFDYHFKDRPDRLLPDALAWVGQSTVAIAIKVAMDNLIKLEDARDDFQVLHQVHDEILGQFKTNSYTEIRPLIQSNMTIHVPYDDPLILPVDMKASRKSWGHCKAVPWVDNHNFCPY